MERRASTSSARSNRDPLKIAVSLKRTAERTRRCKSAPCQPAMSKELEGYSS